MKATLPAAPVPTSQAATWREGGPARSKGSSRTGVRLMGVLAAFLIAVAGVMAWGSLRQSRHEPWRSTELAAMQASLHGDPKNEALKTRVRELDQELRLRYFRNLERNRMGAWFLLLTGVALVCVARVWVAAPGTGTPSGRWMAPDRDAVLRGTGRTLLAVAVVWVGGMVLAGVAFRVRLPEGNRPGLAAGEASPEPGRVGDAVASDPTEAAPAGGVGPSTDDLIRNWPRFRGYDGSGRVAESSVPLTWDVASGAGVLWKAAIPLKGYSSPVIWKERVFLTGGNRQQRRVYALDGTTGAERWARPVIPTDAPEPAIYPPDQSGQAASTPATDGERVYAVFATGELGALDFEGNLVWSRSLDFSENGYGHAASLVVWDDRLYVQDDQGAPEDGKSMLHALEARTGKTLWQAKRPVGGSWTTPVVIEAAGRWQIVTAGDPWLMGHDARTGAELWRANVLGGELAPSPVYAEGRVVATSPGHLLAAVRVDGTGDVTATHVAWQTTDDVPDVPTPSIAGGWVFSADTSGHLVCRDAATGEKLWEHALELEIQASPLVVGDRMYLFAQPGSVRVLRVGTAFELLASFEMGEEIYATPAVAGDRFYIRTAQHVFSIGDGPADAGGGSNDGH